MKIFSHYKLTKGRNIIFPILQFNFNRTQLSIGLVGFTFTFGKYKEGASEL